MSASQLFGAMCLGAVLLAGWPAYAAGQEVPPGQPGRGSKARTPKAQADGAARPSPPSPLFARETPLAVTFTTNIKQIRRDKADKAPWRAATLAVTDDAGNPVSLAARTRTHGVWRLKNCAFPPLRLDILGEARKRTPFRNLGETKMVNFCQDTDRFEQLVLSEFQLYRVYQVLTPVSHHVRLLRVTYVDSASGRPHATRYSFLIEDPNRMAARLGGKLIRVKGAGPENLEPSAGAVALLFEYLIGNADFSFSHLHNTELVGRLDGSILPVVYDFDFSGAVDAPYATPDPMFNIRSVRTRVFRGYCAHKEHFPAAVALFQQKKDAIYALYRDEVGQLMNRDVADKTLRYFDEFYESISTPRKAESVFGRCVGSR